MRNGSEAGSYLGLIVFVYHSTLCLRVMMKKKKMRSSSAVPRVQGVGSRVQGLRHVKGSGLGAYNGFRAWGIKGFRAWDI